MLNHEASINRVSSKLSLRMVITIYEKRSRAHGSAVTRVARQHTLAPFIRLSNVQGLLTNYRDVLWRCIDGDESGIGNLLLVAVMSCIDPSAVQTARPVFDAQNHVYAYAHECIHIRALNMYLNVVQCLSIKLLVHECWRITRRNLIVRVWSMEMSKFSAHRKQSQRAPH